MIALLTVLFVRYGLGIAPAVLSDSMLSSRLAPSASCLWWRLLSELTRVISSGRFIATSVNRRIRMFNGKAVDNHPFLGKNSPNALRTSSLVGSSILIHH